EHKELTKDLGEHTYNSEGICITCNAKKPLNKYLVTFDTDFGSYIAPTFVYEGFTLTAPEEPTKENFAFYGWYDKSDYSGGKFDFSSPITSDMTLYARWGYSFTCVNCDGSTFQKDVYLDGETVKPVDDPTKENEQFIGWYLDPNLEGEKFVFNAEIHENLIVYASFGFQVNFYINDSTLFTTSVVPEGKKATLPEAPRKQYFDFENWYTDIELTKKYDFSKVVDAPLNLYANFTPHYFDIVYHNCESATNPNPNRYQYTVGLPSLLDASKEGYRFYGWYSDEQLTHRVTSIDVEMHEQIDLYAYFSKEYKVTYTNWPKDIANPNPTSFTAEEREDLVLNPFAEYPGFTFVNYTDSKGQVREKTDVDSDMQLTVNYTSTTTHVTFDANGGGVIGLDNFIYLDSLIPGSKLEKYSVPAITDTSDNGFNPNKHVPSYPGHVFKGWCVDKALTTPINKNSLTVLESGSTLYAKWIDVPEEYGNIFDGIAYHPGWVAKPFSYSKDDTVYIPYNISQMDITYFAACTDGKVKIKSSDYSDVTFESHIIFDSDPNLSQISKSVTLDCTDATKINFSVEISCPSGGYEECNPAYSYTFGGFKYRNEYIKVGPSETTSMDINYWDETSLPYIEKEGHSFDGWYYGEKLVDISKHFTFVNKEMTLVAHWTKNS
ncbi:MAG: InlB B-repeat-containing protein, partial [Bacilli bacterium]|nr:InlB B-repeat-containing protein [Bacilli bacterium]